MLAYIVLSMDWNLLRVLQRRGKIKLSPRIAHALYMLPPKFYRGRQLFPAGGDLCKPRKESPRSRSRARSR